MSVTTVKEEWRQRNASGGGALKQKVVRSWLIYTNDKTDGPGDVYLGAAASLPAQFESHPELPQATAREISIQNLEETPLVWRATVTYSSEPITKEEEDEHEISDPLSRPPKISIDRENFEVAVTEDRDGKAILNSAGDPFLDPIIWPSTRKKFNVTFNSATIPAWHDALEGMVNDGDVTIVKGGTATVYAANSLLFIPGNISDLKDEDGTTYMEISFALLHNRRGWTVRLLDAGLYQVVDDVRTRIQVENDSQELVDVSEPVPLDGAGAVLANPTPATAHFNDFEIAEEGDFSILPLDDT